MTSEFPFVAFHTAYLCTAYNFTACYLLLLVPTMAIVKQHRDPMRDVGSGASTFNLLEEDDGCAIESSFLCDRERLKEGRAEQKLERNPDRNLRRNEWRTGCGGIEEAD